MDASNGRPVEGAVVEAIIESTWERKPVGNLTTRSGSDGKFKISSKQNFHMLYYANPSFQFHAPQGSSWTGRLHIKHDKYVTRLLKAEDKWWDERRLDFGEIMLEPAMNENP